ncbi:hypothetical protein, partial [Kribbia dieselivorans]|uniref:hypothetical protein n=1 Tax=Kribbia dieselivorans TaxID=331526 RepID=UPI00146FCCCA
GVLALGGAGALAATGVGGLLPAGPGAARVAASLTSPSSSARSSSSASTPQTRFRHTDTGRRYSWSSLDQQVREQWSADSLDAPAHTADLLFTQQDARGVTTASAIDTLTEAQRCLDLLGQSVRGPVWVDEGRLGTRDVTVIATGSARAGWTVAVVEGANCAPIGAVRQVPPGR